MKYEIPIDNLKIVCDTAGMTSEQRAIFVLLFESDPKIKWQQRAIAREKSFLGCHPRYEADLGLKNPRQTTLRRVRQIINDLRVLFHVPILSESSSKGGYWIPTSLKEVEKNLVRMQQKAIAQARGFLVTYQELHKTFGGSYQSALFEDLEGWLSRHKKNG